MDQYIMALTISFCAAYIMFLKTVMNILGYFSVCKIIRTHTTWCLTEGSYIYLSI